MKKVVAIRHVNFENLGILGSLLSLRGYQIDYYDAGRDDIRAINNEETDLLVVLGGPISAAQHFAGQQHYAFLNDELAAGNAAAAAKTAYAGRLSRRTGDGSGPGGRRGFARRERDRLRTVNIGRA